MSRHHAIPHATRPGQHGFSMLEVLVAILILSIGLLGIAGLLGASLRFAQGGWVRAATSATLADIADRVRANPSATTTAYLLTDDYATQRSAIDAGLPAVSPNCDSPTVNCNPAQLAAFHLQAWRLALDAALPGGAGYITGTRDTGYQATVMWLDKSNVDTSVASQPLANPKTCPATSTAFYAQAAIDQRNCCPAAAAAASGVRCTSLTIVP